VNFNFPPKVPVSLSEVTINNINSLANDISLGLIVSIFFWFIIQYLPDRKKTKSIHLLIEPKIRGIVLQMEEQIGMIIRENKICKTIDKIVKNDLSKIQKIENTNTTFEYEIQINTNWITIKPEKINRIKLLQDQKNNIIKMINEIFQIPSLIYEDSTITNCLSSIKECGFFELIENAKPNQDILNSNMDLFLIDYIDKINLLKGKFTTQNIRY
jgi:hypothetical protein